MVSTEKNRKKNRILSFLTLFLFLGVVFVLQTHIVQASWWDPSTWVQTLLYGVFSMIGLFASLAVTIFEWAIKPDNVTLLFNSPGVYESWKFVRDFFNLFFILVLLYTAFTLVFQINKDFKKALLSIVLAALFINFSFPVSRVLIDVTNVPMYFFANQMMAGSGEGSGVFGSAMTATHIEEILLPDKEDTESISRILMAIVFLFIFSITLLVLSVMFVIRLVALVVLVIFSSVGFAASIIPGLGKYSSMWWDNFWKYAFFGPAAMLMLVVATRLFSSLGDTNGQLMKSMGTVASTTVVGGDSTSFYASMLMFSIPIIMLWMAMSLAQTMSIAGASAVVGKGQAFSKWAGKKTYNNPIGRGLYGGAKKVVMEGKIAGKSYGKLPGGKFLTGDYWATPSKTEATIKGGIAGGWGGGAKERKKLDQQAVIDRVKKDKENQVSNSTHRDNLKNSKNPIEREAAALALANDKEIRTAEELSQAMDALKNNTDGLVKVIENSKSDAIENIDLGSYVEARNLHYEKDPETGELRMREGMERSIEALNSRIKKEGNAKVLVDYEISQLPGGASSATPDQVKNAVETTLESMKSAKDVASSGSLFDDKRYKPHAVDFIKNQGSQRVQEIQKLSAQEGTSVGWALSGNTSATSKEEKENQQKIDEGKRLREKIQARKRENNR